MGPPKGTRVGGRKKGVPNKVNLAVRLRIEQEADPIGRLIDAAKFGKVKIGGQDVALNADQYLAVLRELRRIYVPDAKAGQINIALPVIDKPEDIVKALGAIIAETISGRVALEDAHTLAEIIETKRRAIETVDHEARLAALEVNRSVTP